MNQSGLSEPDAEVPFKEAQAQLQSWQALPGAGPKIYARKVDPPIEEIYAEMNVRFTNAKTQRLCL